MVRGTAVLSEHDPLGPAFYVFGGSTTGWVESARLYRYDIAADSWTLLDDGSGPAPRFKHASALVDGEVWVHGGRDNDGETEVIHSDLWAWRVDGGGWREVETSGNPGPMHRHAVVWDGPRNLLWVHAGFQPEPDAGDTGGADIVRTDGLWVLDLDTLEWLEVPSGDEGPPIRASHLATLAGAQLLVWGGHGTDEQVWAYEPGDSTDSGATGTWTGHDASPRPLARDAMVTGTIWSEDGAVVWLAGGDPASEDVPNFVMDVWKLDASGIAGPDATSPAWTEVIGIP